MASLRSMTEWIGGSELTIDEDEMAKVRSGTNINYKGKFWVCLPTCDREYRYTKAGTLIWGTENFATFLFFKDHEQFTGVPMIPMNSRGGTMSINKAHVRPATPADIERQMAIVQAAKEELQNFPVGLAVVSKGRLRIEKDIHPMYSVTETLWPGVEAVVDTNYAIETKPGPEDKEEEQKAALRERQEDKKLDVSDMQVGSLKLNQLVPPRVRIYIPEEKTATIVEVNEIKPRVFNPKIMDQLILLPGVKDRIKTTISRVLQKDSHSTIYEKLGLGELCSKGRGAVVLLYGVPGSGKTMTAEAFSEYFGKSLLRVEAADMAQVDVVQQNLVEAFRRARKYDAMLLIDEVDVFIRKRGLHPQLDELTSVFLRTIEYYDGIIFMTTNLLGNIDPAIFSRIHLTVGIEEFDADLRKKIWQGMMTPQLLEAITGNTREKEAMFDKLAEINLNGREIKNVIQNCVTHAVVTAGGKDKINGAARWINRQKFVDEAQNLAEQRQLLKRDYSGN